MTGQDQTRSRTSLLGSNFCNNSTIQHLRNFELNLSKTSISLVMGRTTRTERIA